MHTKMWRRNWRRKTLVALVVLLLTSLAIPLIGPPEKTYADSNLDRLCVLPTNDLGGDNHEPRGWLRVEFVNRALIRVSFVGSGECVEPRGNDATYIAASKRFADVVDGDYYDSNTGDNTFQYVKKVGQSGSDDSRLDEFGSGLGEAIKDEFNGQDRAVNADTIRQHIQNVEFTLSVEEDEVPDISCTAQNGNFAFVNVNNDGQGFKWICSSNVGSLKGLRVRNSFVGQLENFNITYGYQDGAIVHVSEGERDTRTFAWCANENRFRSENCNGPLYIDATQQQLDSLGAGTGEFVIRRDNSSGTQTVRVAGSSSASNTATNQVSAPNTSGGEEADASCETNGGGLAWFLCGLLEIADNIIAELDETIYNLLAVPNGYFEGTEAAQDMEETWARLRNIAYVILVPIMLVMIVSTALGFEFVSAYTFKRAFPRLVAAVIFIALSWEITAFLVVLTNNIGTGIGGLITSSFGGAGEITLSSLLNPDGADAATAGFLGLAALGGAAAIGSIGILLSYAFVTVIALLIGFILLAFRQMLIIALMLLSPLAILAWIFPGNDKLWKLWWGAFSKLLLLFPIIAILLSAGRAFADVASDLDTSPITTFIVIAAYIGPYFFIPAAFKFAGGVFATVAGMAQDRERGLFDRNKKYRQEKAASNWSDFKKGDRAWRPSSFNNLGRRIDAGWKGGYGFGRRGRAAMDIRGRANAAAAQKDELMNQLQFDDDGIMAMALSGGNKDAARSAMYNYRNRLLAEGRRTGNNRLIAEANKWDDSRIEKAVQTAGSVGYNRSNATAALDMMARNKSFSLVGGPVGMETMLDATSRLAGGNQQMAENLMGSFEFNSRQAGRFDLGAHDYSNGDVSMSSAWSKATLGQHAQGTSASLQAFADYHLDRLENGNQVERRNAAIAMMELQNMLPNSTAGNQKVINDTMFRMRDDVGRRIGLDFDAGTPVEDQIAAIAGTGAVGTRAVDLEGRSLSGQTIRGMARVYDRDASTAERDASGGAPPEASGPSPGGP